MPAHLLEPELLPGLADWFETFIELSNDRQLGETVGPIPAASIARQAAALSADDADLFRACIRALDAVYLEYVAWLREEKQRAAQ